jgi:hypothetical protein
MSVFSPKSGTKRLRSNLDETEEEPATATRWTSIAAKFDINLQQLLNEESNIPQSQGKEKKSQGLGGKASARPRDIQRSLTQVKLAQVFGAEVPEEIQKKIAAKARLHLDLAQISFNRAQGHSDFTLKEFGLAQCRADSCKEVFKIAVNQESKAAEVLQKARELFKEACPHGPEKLQHSTSKVTVRDHGFESTRNHHKVFHVCLSCKRKRPASSEEADEYLSQNNLV